MTIAINYKLVSSCPGGGHYSVDLTPGPTVFLLEERARQLKAMVDEMSSADRVSLSLALHANANNLTLGEVRDEVAAVAGLDLVL